uniref:Meiosis specific with OB-fold n=1 Tax=Homo sapiens TaxID=9606 RepID=H3BU18_HUMAN
MANSFAARIFTTLSDLQTNMANLILDQKGTLSASPFGIHQHIL